jgi:membrane protein implicated in regulation of membrane protease activity
MDGSEKLRKEIYIALKSGVSHWDLRLLSLNGILVSREEELVVVSRWSLKHLTPVAILSCILACIALIGLTACSVAETWLKTALICLLAASLTYLSRKWHQRRSLISESRRRVIDYLKRRGPVPNVTRLPGRWPLVVIEPTWIPRSAESPTRSRYRNL